MAFLYLSIVALIPATACQDETLLTPKLMVGDVNGLELDLLADGRYDTYWRANNNGHENVYFYFMDVVEVKWIFVQRYNDDAQYVYIYDASSQLTAVWFGDSTESYSSITVRFDNVYTDTLRFYFYFSSTVQISRLEVYGCYNTTTPTTSPTTEGPSGVPTPFPTLSPTIPPVTTLPSRTPSTSPTMAPTASPSTAYPSPYPTTIPSRSPTSLPTINTDIPSTGPTSSPTATISTKLPSAAPSLSPTAEPSVAAQSAYPSTSPSFSPTMAPTTVNADGGDFEVTLGEIELFLVVASCLCIVILCLSRRYLKSMQVNGVLHNSANNVKGAGYNTQQNAEHNETQMSLYRVAVRVGQTNNTRDNVEENAKQTNMTLNIVGDNTRSQGKEVSGERGDVRFALDKVSSVDGMISDTAGGLEIGKQESAL